ncbi:MAG: 16S rRNA methyltransferase [Chloroflexi bacterium]|nr:16S rRNA methyltransferase [Chloroflexota bacterium]
MKSAVDDLDRLVQAVLQSPKYRNVCPDVIRNIGARELATRRSWKEALKATKNKLHQVGGAYFDAGTQYTYWLDELKQATQAADDASLRRVCKEIMKHHSSTRERLGILDQFYASILAELPPVQRVLDIACGLNPLAIPWMGLGKDVQYYAYDMYIDLVDFLNQFMAMIGVQGQAYACDIAYSPPPHQTDLAFILKSLPCLEQLDRSASQRLLEAVQADYLVISFPVRSLGGREKGMVQNYEERFWELMSGKPWTTQRFVFATELAFLVKKTES